MKTNILIGILAIGALGLVTLFSFGGNEEEVIQTENKASSEVASEVSLPDDVPDNIPLYPGAVLKSAQEVPQESARNINLSLETSDSVSDVNAWYRGALSENEWAVTSDKNVGGYTLLKGERENVAVFMQAAMRSDLGVVVITQRIQIK